MSTDHPIHNVVPGSHAISESRPDAVADLIKQAAVAAPSGIGVLDEPVPYTGVSMIKQRPASR